MKKRHLINLLLFLSIFISACGNKEKKEIESAKEKFENTIINLINIVNENYINTSIYNNEYHSYYLSDTLLYGYNYNSQTNSFDYNFKYNLIDENIMQGKIIKNKNDKLYVSIENDEYCAVKDFDETTLTIYNISEKEKCYISHYAGENLEVSILAFTVNTQQFYQSGEISNDSISLLITSNLIDANAATYKWYKNNELLNSNNLSYYILENENAEYYVELTTTDGKTVKSEPFHVIIQK